MCVSLGYVQVRHVTGNSPLSHVPEVQQLDVAGLVVRDRVCVCVSLGYIQVKHVKGSVRGGGLGSRPKKMYGERLGDGVEYHLMSPTPRR